VNNSKVEATATVMLDLFQYRIIKVAIMLNRFW
jgi:hypothetical protein